MLLIALIWRIESSSSGTPIRCRPLERALTRTILGYGNIALRPAALRNTAWDTLQVSGAALQLDVELLERVSALHERQDWYVATVSKAVDQLYQANLSRQGLEPRGFFPTIGDLAAQETELLELYADVLGRLD